MGRERELATVERLLADHRLLTLSGVGGSGKTRLALEAAKRAAPRFADGVVWVELASIPTGEDPAARVGVALGIQEQAGVGPEEAVLGALRSRSTLLLLDNCEHVVEDAAHLAEAVLRSCPDVRVLATSREPLGVPGEIAWQTPPLSLPPADGTIVPGDAARAEAVLLFAERARSVRPDFEITDANLATVARICHRLDGIPLALEFAAARLRSLSVEEIARRLDDRFELLTTGSRTALPRHRTLHAAIDWSYRLLDEEERIVLERLSVFAGSFALEAAEAVCGFEPIDPSGVMDWVAELVEKSLVDLVDREAEARYRLLESIRQFAADRLEESGRGDGVQARHAAHFLALATEADPRLTTPDYPRWVERLSRDVDNLRRALEWSRDSDPRLHLALVGRLCWFWYSSANLSEGRRWIEGALALPVAADPGIERARALLAGGILASLQAEPELSRPWLDECVVLARDLGERRIEAHAYNYLGLTYVQEGRTEGRGFVEKGIELFREMDDLYGLRPAYLILGNHFLGQGAVDDAVRACEESVAVAQRFGRRRELGVALQSLGTAVLQQGDVERAATLLRESLEALSRDRLHVFIARSLELLGITLVRRGSPAEGARLIGAAERVREVIGAHRFVMDSRRVEPALEAAAAALGDADLEAALAEGRSLPLEAAIAFGLSTVDAPAPRPTPTRPPVARVQPTKRRLAVRALGPLEVEVDGEPLPEDAWPYAKPKELLLYLLYHDGGRARDDIGAVLWPDATPAQIKNSFHVTLHHLRKALGEAEWIRLDRGEYRLNDEEREVELDALRFEEAMREELQPRRRRKASIDRLRAALQIYRGDFLDGEVAGGWHVEIKDRLLGLYLEGRLAYADALHAAGRFGEAAEAYERVLRRDELREEAYRGFMLSAARGGDAERALREYDRFSEILRRDLNEAPPSEIEILAERIGRGDPPDTWLN